MNNGKRVAKNIAVVIPCYNESSSIAQVIAKLPAAELAKDSYQLRVYVVDNNSSDGTGSVAKQAGATVIYEPQKGKGFALRAGFRALADDIDFVVMLDGDDTYSSEEIRRMVEPLACDFCDVVVGSRLGGRIQTSAMTAFNLFGNWLFTNAVRTVYRANVTDVLTGYFAWKKDALDALYPHLKSEGFAIEMEMVTKMARLGLRLTSVPISYHPRAGESHLRPLRDGTRILKMFLKNLTWRAWRWQASPLPILPKKIIFVSDGVYPYMKGGKEKRLYEISTRLANIGCDVHIYTMHWWPEPQRIITENNVQLHAICNYHDMYHGDRRAIKEGIVFGLACFKLMGAKFDVLDVDHMPFFPIFSTWLVCTLRRRKFFGTWHEALSPRDWARYMGRLGSIAALIERLCVRLPHTITAASAHTKELLASIHGRVERVALVASGIDTALIRTVEPAPVRCDVLYVGRLVKDKNIHTLIAAIGRIHKTNPAVQCMIIGQGAEKSRLQHLTTKLGLQANITFLEPLAEAAEVYARMKAAKVFCLPSSREGFSIVTLEALGCGTPVVTTDAASNAAKSFIENGQSGSIVPCTAKDFARATAYWISRDDKPDTAAAVAHYDWHDLAKQQLEVYTS